MSATPERTDGFDIFKLFNHNIAYEIRLSQAMEYDLVCPFHYFGISDLVINGKTFDDNSDFNLLTSSNRVDHIIRNIETYGYHGDKLHGLVFTSNVEEANKLADLFNQRGYRSVALTGKDNEMQRELAISRLEMEESEDSLDYIFTVDIFNEGIDIPKVNQVIMLRPTQSSIIFIQQLGRGLRKLPNKDYVVVLDFIANYQNNFMIPLALSGSRSYNKDVLRKTIITTKAFIPGCSTVSFDEISKKEIFKSIDNANFNNVKLIKDEYIALKNKLGKIPGIKDFEEHDSIDVQRIFESKSLGSYHTFLKKNEKDYKIILDDIQENMLKFVSSKLSNGKRDNELMILKGLIEKYGHGNQSDFIIEPYLSNNTAKILTNDFCVSVNSKKTFDKSVFIEANGGSYQISAQFKTALEDLDFVRALEEVVDYGLDLSDRKYSKKYQDTDFVLYEKYSYEDVCRLLDWDKNLVSLNIGGYKYDKGTNTFPVFINYNKEEDINDTINYEDHFTSRKTIKAMSKSKRDLNSPDIKTIYNFDKNNTDICLFVRKNKDDKGSKEFYYLGRIRPVDEPNLFTMKNTDTTAVEITYQLDTPVREDIFEYITKVVD